MEKQLLFIETNWLYRLKRTLINSFIIHSKPFRETSMIYDVLTDTDGLISIIAKGIKSKKDGLSMQPFKEIKLTFVITVLHRWFV